MDDLSSKAKRRIKRILREEKPTIWIGKSGLSCELLTEIHNQLEKREMVKIRILKSALHSGKASEVASKIITSIEAKLVEVRGHTMMLYRMRKK